MTLDTRYDGKGIFYVRYHDGNVHPILSSELDRYLLQRHRGKVDELSLRDDGDTVCVIGRIDEGSWFDMETYPNRKNDFRELMGKAEFLECWRNSHPPVTCENCRL